MIKTQCPYCGCGCGLIIEKKNGEIKIKGNREHPASKGSICIKAVKLPKTLDKNRLDKVLYRESKNEDFREISWDSAYEILKEKLTNLSPNEIYFYISGQLLTEEMYVINKFVKGFLKTNNIDSNSRLCVASAVTAYKMAFGSDGLPGCNDDIDDADCFIFVGSNAAIAHPGIFRRIIKKKDKEIVVIDFRYTETAKYADKWIPIKAGTDVALFNSILYILYKENKIYWNFIKKYTDGFDKVLEVIKNYPPEKVAKLCEISEEDIYYLANLYANKKKVLTFWSMGINQSTNGTMKALSIINVHLATGRLNDRGCPFSLTGQSNAMGGREVGYLSNGLPGFRDVRNKEDREFVEKFWGIEAGSIKDKPGLSITEAVDKILDGEIKFIWIVCTNPAVSMANLNKFIKALKKEDVFVVVQDAYFTDTVKLANLALPAAQWGEKDGVMTGGDRVVTYCQKFRETKYKPDWKIFAELAKKMGFEKYFNYKSARDIFEEFKKLTKGRMCDISNFSYEDLPKRWGNKHLYKDLKFKTENKKAKFIPTEFKEPEDWNKEGFIISTGRLKKHWHTMTRTIHIKEFLDEIEPIVEINKKDAKELGLNEGDIVKLVSERGEIIRKVKFANIKPKHLFTPFGYNRNVTKYQTNQITTDKSDPYSKEPELKFSKVKIWNGN
ncbi:molybdopterin oxidoreductase family protein [Methanocaldococcus indicus]|uniref:molybdopterin oxidoreductase family protein n=1 Tax=Methanocaldococcus indicus TaxID=213231 RepID=UPI003C6CD603